VVVTWCSDVRNALSYLLVLNEHWKQTIRVCIAFLRALASISAYQAKLICAADTLESQGSGVTVTSQKPTNRLVYLQSASFYASLFRMSCTSYCNFCISCTMCSCMGAMSCPCACCFSCALVVRRALHFACKRALCAAASSISNILWVQQGRQLGMHGVYYAYCTRVLTSIETRIIKHETPRGQVGPL